MIPLFLFSEKSIVLLSRIALIAGYEENKVKETLSLLLRDRKNEFKELAGAIGIPVTSKDWEVIVLKYCLDFEECFKTWTDDKEPSSLKNAKCMTIMRQMAKGKKNIHQLINLEDIAFTICTEFHQTYDRLS